MGRLRTNMGIHPMGLQWHLKQGGVFNTPEAVLVRSDEGLGKEEEGEGGGADRKSTRLNSSHRR